MRFKVKESAPFKIATQLMLNNASAHPQSSFDVYPNFVAIID